MIFITHKTKKNIIEKRKEEKVRYFIYYFLIKSVY
jgi:hypothetical protein